MKIKHKLIKTGTYSKGSSSFTIDDNLLNHWADTYKNWVEKGHKVPLTLNHSDDPLDSVGLLEEVVVEDNALVGTFELSFDDEEVVNENLPKCGVSIYSPKEYTDGKGDKWEYPLVHVALTNNPVAHDLGDFYFSMPVKSIKTRIREFFKESVDPVQVLSEHKKTINVDEENTMEDKKLVNVKLGEMFKKRLDDIKVLTPAGKSKIEEKLTDVEFSNEFINDLDFIFELLENYVVEKTVSARVLDKAGDNEDELTKLVKARLADLNK